MTYTRLALWSVVPLLAILVGVVWYIASDGMDLQWLLVAGLGFIAETVVVARFADLRPTTRPS